MSTEDSNKKKKANRKQFAFYITFVVTMGLFAAIRHGFALEIPMNHTSKETVMTLSLEAPEQEAMAAQTNTASLNNPEDEELYTEYPDSLIKKTAFHETTVNAPEDDLLFGDSTSEVYHPQKELPKAQGAHRVRGVWSYVECFPDVQDVQIIAATKNGIRPVRNRDEAEKLVKRHKLVNISHSPFYKVDKLTHSIPYLVPQAQHLLNTICLNFIDSCVVKGLPVHLPIVTSVLRTTDDVSNLQKGNKNATDNSCHCYGTTVDIAYNRFYPLTGSYSSETELLRWDEPMKQVLSEVLFDLRKQQRCYVKYEKKQGCFHLTCR
ncbi:MAG: hypothetical protein K2O61_02835 [Bacteroidaceae bacterium]|nr:hypothetical protein [Bacteroidaceae bacterium]